MWKMSKSLAACVFAAVWLGIFYPELCFSEETCAVVQTEDAQDEGKEAQSQTERRQKRSERLQSALEEIDAAAVWRASGDEIVIRSKLWEWCVENLFDA